MTLKIGVCSLNVGEKYKQLTKYSRENKIQYCTKHNYEFIEDDDIVDYSRPIPWSKILLILKYIKNYDYIVWIDADMLVMNDSIKIESFINKYQDYNIICGNDWRMINTGFLIVKNNNWSIQFWKDVYDDTIKYDPESDPKERYQNWEQGKFIFLWDQNHLGCQDLIKVTNPIEMNSYWYNYFPGHFILHFPAVRGDVLSYLIKDYCPNRMDIDTDDSYNKRMAWLAGPVRDDLDKKLQRDRENDLKRIRTETKLENLSIISKDDYLKLIEQYQFHLDNLLQIVKDSGEKMEGNYMYVHETFEKNEVDYEKQMNLYSLGALSCVENVLEIGTNAGHSLLLLLLSNEKSKICCFDLCEHTYTRPCVEYLQAVFPNRVQLFAGCSKTTVPEYKEKNPDMKFDLIHIDGSHDGHIANCDFYNTLKMSKKGGILIFDDIYIPVLQHLVDGYIDNNHLLKITNVLPIKTYPHFVGLYK